MKKLLFILTMLAAMPVTSTYCNQPSDNKTFAQRHKVLMTVIKIGGAVATIAAATYYRDPLQSNMTNGVNMIHEGLEYIAESSKPFISQTEIYLNEALEYTKTLKDDICAVIKKGAQDIANRF